MVARFHDAGLEVILDVVYNHTAEGNERGATLSFRGIDNAHVLPPDARATALLHQRHGHRQHAESEPPARHSDGDRQPALLGAGDARRRFQIRSRHDPRARAERLRQSQRLPEGLLAGSGARRRQADRRAVGLRPRRLSGRRVPAGLGRVERPVSRHGARLLARRGAGRSARAAPVRLGGHFRSARPPPAGERQLRHGARRLHAQRPRFLQRTAQRSERRGQPGRSRRTTAPGTAAPRDRPTTQA